MKYFVFVLLLLSGVSLAVDFTVSFSKESLDYGETITVNYWLGTENITGWQYRLFARAPYACYTNNTGIFQWKDARMKNATVPIESGSIKFQVTAPLYPFSNSTAICGFGKWHNAVRYQTIIVSAELWNNQTHDFLFHRKHLVIINTNEMLDFVNNNLTAYWANMNGRIDNAIALSNRYANISANDTNFSSNWTQLSANLTILKSDIPGIQATLETIKSDPRFKNIKKYDLMAASFWRNFPAIKDRYNQTLAATKNIYGV